MAQKSLFERLAEQLQATPEAIQESYKEITINTVNQYFDKFAQELKDTSKSDTLNQQMEVNPPELLEGRYYKRSLNWNDKLVNPNRTKKRDKKTRKNNKRNYSNYPATYHDLAYIINYGQEGIAGTYFINKAKRKLKRWEAQRDRKFKKSLLKIRLK